MALRVELLGMTPAERLKPGQYISYDAFNTHFLAEIRTVDVDTDWHPDHPGTVSVMVRPIGRGRRYGCTFRVGDVVPTLLVIGGPEGGVSDDAEDWAETLGEGVDSPVDASDEGFQPKPPKRRARGGRRLRLGR